MLHRETSGTTPPESDVAVDVVVVEVAVAVAAVVPVAFVRVQEPVVVFEVVVVLVVQLVVVLLLLVVVLLMGLRLAVIRELAKFNLATWSLSFKFVMRHCILSLPIDLMSLNERKGCKHFQ